MPTLSPLALALEKVLEVSSMPFSRSSVSLVTSTDPRLLALARNTADRVADIHNDEELDVLC